LASAFWRLTQIAQETLAQSGEFRQKTHEITGLDMTDEVLQRDKDAEEHRRSYDTIMGACTEIGVPAAMGLATFFTSWVMENGFLLSLFAGIATYVFAYFVVKTFFSH